jgi:putative DNA primase/helicase
MDKKAMKRSSLLNRMEGQWEEFFIETIPSLKSAIQSCPYHVSCPVHGGSKEFRCFSDFPETGGGICNSCGAFSNGIKLFEWAAGCDSAEARKIIREWLNNNDLD